MSESHDDQSKFRLKKLSTDDAEALIAKAISEHVGKAYVCHIKKVRYRSVPVDSGHFEVEISEDLDSSLFGENNASGQK